MRSALKLRASDRLPTPSPRRAARKARTSRAWRRQQMLHVGQAIEMAGEEGEELGDVSLVGFGRIAGQLALDTEISEPVPHRLADESAPHITRRFGPLRQACDPYFGL